VPCGSRAERRVGPGFSPYTLLGAHAQVSTELLFELLSPRRLRNPRVVKRKMLNFAVRRAIHRTAQLPSATPRQFTLLST